MGDGGSKEICELKSCKSVVSETGISCEEGRSFQALVFASLFLDLSFLAPFLSTYVFYFQNKK